MSQEGCSCKFFERMAKGDDNQLKMNIKGFVKLAIVLFYFLFIFSTIR